jgi:hypothetical protein
MSDDDKPARLDDDREEPVVASDETPDDTSGGPLSSGAGEGSGQGAEGAPDVDVPGGASHDGGATEGAVGGG